jgi:hypothetical protein
LQVSIPANAGAEIKNAEKTKNEIFKKASHQSKTFCIDIPSINQLQIVNQSQSPVSLKARGKTMQEIRHHRHVINSPIRVTDRL